MTIYAASGHAAEVAEKVREDESGPPERSPQAPLENEEFPAIFRDYGSDI
jgi:hypothetical protein